MFNTLPWIVTVLLVGIPVLVLLVFSRKHCVRAWLLSAAFLLLVFLYVYVPGWILMVKANRGDAQAMFELARWTENHDEQIGAVILWPFTPDVLGGYEWLEKSASLDYPPAIYALGVRLKYGEHVPRPANWDGAEGNYFPQPERGQAYIDRAI